jgi:hypothetical protein
MAGDWIKMRVDLPSDPAVVRIRRSTGLDADSVVGKLHRLWAWADTHTDDGTAVGLDAEWIDELAGAKGFADAMQAAGWLEIDDGWVRFMNFDRHNGRPAKSRALAKTRMLRSRCGDSATQAQPEKRREEKRRDTEEPAAQDATSDPPQRRKRSQPAASISWTAESGWTGITDADRSEWRQAFPGAVIEQELAKSTAWLRANPTKAGKRNWRGFLVRWLSRCQDRGGTNREPRGMGPPGPAPIPQERRRYYRADAGCSMNDKDYAAWRRDRQSGGTVSQVAGSLTVKEE